VGQLIAAAAGKTRLHSRELFRLVPHAISRQTRVLFLPSPFAQWAVPLFWEWDTVQQAGGAQRQFFLTQYFKQNTAGLQKRLIFNAALIAFYARCKA